MNKSTYHTKMVYLCKNLIKMNFPQMANISVMSSEKKQNKTKSFLILLHFLFSFNSLDSKFFLHLKEEKSTWKVEYFPLQNNCHGVTFSSKSTILFANSKSCLKNWHRYFGWIELELQKNQIEF